MQRIVIKKTGRRIAVRIVLMYIMFLLLFSAAAVLILWKVFQIQNERSLYELLDQEIAAMKQESYNHSLEAQHERDEHDHQPIPNFTGREFGRSGLWFRLLQDQEGDWAPPYERVPNLSGQVEPLLSSYHPESRETKAIRVTINVENAAKPLNFIVAAALTDQGWLYVGNETGESQKLWLTTVWWLLSVVGIFAVAGSVLAWFVTGRSLKPVAEALKRQSQFVSNASHEFRTPLSILRTSLDCLSVEESVIRSESAQHWMLNIYDEVDRMSGIIDRLLSLARIENGAKPVIERVDLSDLFAMLLKRMEVQARPKRLRLINETETSLVWDGDPVLIEQLLTIFLENAIKYSPETGAISINAKLKSKGRGGHKSILRLEVANEGAGIDPAHLPHLFERFYVADESRTKRDGLGIGLSIAKAIVVAHGGQIGAESEEGNGAMFWVELPGLHKR